jgi:hypothetical protein
MPIIRIVGTSPDFYTILGPHVTDPAVIRKRCNLPITTKDTITWHVLKKNGKVKAFVGEDPVPLPKKDMKDKELPAEQRPLQQTKLQAFVALEASDDELLDLLGEVVTRFEKSESPMLTISVLNEYAVLFKKARFRVIGHKTKWTDLAIVKT